jgi:vacuolar protein sorting-associated protein 45
MVSALLKYGGAAARGKGDDLFGFKGAAGFFKKMTGGLKGVENIYTQHQPLLSRVLDQLSKGKLNESLYPFMDRSFKDR